ncbi:hypothetical protein ACI2K4_13140 [Micromonospora sp. NPDC050397]|uniref:hypothetical protein n=1 Tax=Micromonospora sp. NPDC050397 TaxID=3364279 RepID=UPI00384A949A
MADQNEFAYDDSALDAEFDAFRTGLFDQVVPPGPDAVRRTVRHRRRVATTGGLALALVLVVGPVTALAALNKTPTTPSPPIATTQPDPSPTTTPSPTASPTPSTAASSTAPNGRISRSELLGARLDLPAWRPGPSCADEGARLSERSTGNFENELITVGYGDIDDDGATETVVLVRCSINQGGPAQVVAFDRDDSGRIVTVGQVVRSALEKPQWLLDLQVRADGVIRVQVADIAPGGGWNLEWSQKQWRGYKLDGGKTVDDAKFVQTEGERSFPDNPYQVNLQVTATDLVYGPADEAGARTGTVTVTVKNVGPVNAARPRLDFALRPGGVGTAASPGWYACQDVRIEGEQTFCTLPALGPGTERKLTFHLVSTGPELPTSGTIEIRPLDAKGKVAPEGNDWDNKISITIK